MSSLGGLITAEKRLIKRTGTDPIVSVFFEIFKPQFRDEVVTTSIFSSDQLFLINLENHLRKRISYVQSDTRGLKDDNFQIINSQPQNCLNFQVPNRRGFPLNRRLNQLEFQPLGVFFTKLAASIIKGVPNFIYTIENILVTENEIFPNISDITSLCFLLRETPVSTEQFRQFCTYLDSRVLEREPIHRTNHQLKLNSMFVVLLEVVTQTPINFLSCLEQSQPKKPKKSKKGNQRGQSISKIKQKQLQTNDQVYLKYKLANQLTIEQCKQIMKMKPAFYKRVINNQRNSRILKALAQEMDIDLIDIFTKILVDQQVYSWNEIIQMLFHRNPLIETQGLWLDIANKLWKGFSYYEKKYFFDNHILSDRKIEELTLLDYEAFFVTVLDLNWEDVLIFPSFSNFMLHKRVHSPEASQFWQKCVKILEPLILQIKTQPTEKPTKDTSENVILNELFKISKTNLTKEIDLERNSLSLAHHRYSTLKQYKNKLK